MKDRKFKFLVDSELKINTEIDIFIKHYKKKNVSHFLIDGPVQCRPEKAILMQTFCSWYIIETVHHSVHLRVFQDPKTPVFLGLITK